MERTGPRMGEQSRFRIIRPRNLSSESAPKSVQWEMPGPVSHLRNTLTHASQLTLYGDAGATYAQGHTKPLQTCAEPDLYTNSFLLNVETNSATSWPAQLAPGLGAQADQRDPNNGINPIASSYEGMMQPPFGETSFASPQDPWTGPPFAHGRETLSTANTYCELSGSQAYPNFISRSMNTPLQFEQLWADSSVLVEEAFSQVNSSFPEQTMPYESTHPRIDVNTTEDFLDFSESLNDENWHSFPSEIVEEALGGPLDNRSADDDFDDFSMFINPLTPTKRLGPTLAAFMLGIPEDPGEVTRNIELQFSYETTSSQNHEDNSTGITQSPNTLQASDSGSSPTLAKVSSHQSSVTLSPEQNISPHGIESGPLQSEDEETRSSTTLDETRRSMELSSKEDYLSVTRTRLRAVLPLLPPPADFSHTNIVVKAPAIHSSVVVDKYLKVASEAKQYGESKLATALPAVATLPLAVPLLNQKRARGPGDDLVDLSDHETCTITEETESEVITPPSTTVAPSSVFSRKKRGKLSMQKRVSTARIRRLGACLRCGILKEKCSDGVPCERCIEVSQSKHATFVIPCCRSKLGDIELFRRRTQHGLFVYTYTKQSDNLHARSVRIFDPEKLRESSRYQVPFTCHKELTIESLRPLKYLDSHLLPHRDQNGRLLQYACTMKQLEKGKVITTYLDRQMRPVLNALGTSHQFVRLTLDIAERYSQSPDRKMLRNSLRIFTARFLRRKFWVSTPDENSYDVAWMDVPWRAMPVLPPKTLAEAETLNKILKDYLFSLESSIIRDFKAKVYARKLEDWFELFLVTFIFQVVLSEKLEMSFYSNVKGADSALEMPWSTFGGLRSYSSQVIAAHFRAIKGPLPFHLPKEERAALGKLGDLENSYLDACPRVLKDAMLKKGDLGSRRSSSSGHGGTPGSWWQWAIETVLDSDAPD